MMNARQEIQPLHFLCIIDEWLLVGLEKGDKTHDYRRPAHLSSVKPSRR